MEYFDEYKNLDLKGNVKFLKETRYEVIDSSGVFVRGKLEPTNYWSFYPIHIYEFDINNNIKSETVIDTSLDTRYRISYYYSQNKLREVRWKTNEDEFVLGTFNYRGNYIYNNTPDEYIGQRNIIYNQKNARVSWCISDTNNVVHCHSYYYRRGDNYIRQTDSFTEDSGWLSDRKFDIMDTIGGNMLEETWCLPDGRCWRKQTYKYDQYGNNIECQDCWYSEDTTCYTDIFAYDKNRNRIKKLWFDENGEFKSGYIYRYDSLSNIILDCDSLMVYSDTCNCYNLQYRCAEFYYIYDINRNILEKGRLRGSTQEKQFTYKYDIYNNLIEQIAFTKGNVPMKIRSREIVYY